MKKDAQDPENTLTPQEWDRVTNNLESLSRELNRFSDNDTATPETRDPDVAASAVAAL